MRLSFVRNRQRARLFDLWTFMVLVVLLVVALVLVFPRQLSLQATDYIERPSAVSLAYLQALVRAYPDDGWLRLQLARQYRQVGQFPQASLVLEPLATHPDGLSPELARAVRWLNARLDLDRMLTLPAGSPQRGRLQRSLIDQLNALVASPAAEAADLAWLAETALTVNQPGLAADVFRRLATEEPARSVQHLMAAGRWYTASNRPEAAVEAYRAVVEDRTAAVSVRGAAAAALVRVWFSAGRVEQALHAATDLLERFPNDSRLLRLAQRAALESGDPEAALVFALRRWPGRTDMRTSELGQRLRLEMEAGRLADGAATAQVLVARRPRDAALRQRLAELLEWSGRPREALRQWLWLVERGDEGLREPPVWQLALDLYAFETAQRLLLSRLGRRPLRSEELAALRWATGQAGEPEATIRALQAAAGANRADAAHWRYWLDLLRETGRQVEWLRRMEGFAARFPVDTGLRVTWARTLMTRGDWTSALSVLDAGRPPEAKAATAYWEAVAAAALTLEDLERSAAAYETLLESGDRSDPDMAHRLLALSLFLDRRERALELADDLWRRTGDPYFLVVALRSAEALGRSGFIRASVTPVPPAAGRYADFWRFLAEYHRDRGATAASGEAYRRALALAPDAADLRAAYLWHLVDTGQTGELARRMALWRRPPVSGDVAAALAVGYQSLGRHREALAWYGREVPARRREWLWLLGYADALEGAGYPPAAYRLRRYVLRGLLRHNEDEPALGVARAGLIHRIMGPPVGYRAVPGTPDASAWYPLLVGWYLDGGMDIAARRSLLAAHQARIEMPAWQRLGLALRENDLDRIEALLAEETRLSAADRASGLERLGREAEAFALAQDAVDGRGAADGGPVALATALSSRLAPGAQTTAQGVWSDDASWLGGTARVREPVGQGVVTGMVSGRETRSDELFAEGPLTSSDLAVGWEAGDVRQRWSAALGVGSRDGRARPSASLTLERALRADLTSSVSLQWNRMPEASPVLDAVGAYRGVALDGQWNLTGRTAVAARARYGAYVDWWDGGSVVRGADGSIGVSDVIWAAPVLWQISLGMDWQAYQRIDDPGTGFGGRLVADADGDSLALRRARIYRLGSRWQHGEPAALGGRATSPRWYVDLGAGWQAPQDELLLSAEAAVGWPLLGGDELALRARYSENARTAAGFQAGLGLTYTYWFGQ